jgi:hypothetical protein
LGRVTFFRLQLNAFTACAGDTRVLNLFRTPSKKSIAEVELKTHEVWSILEHSGMALRPFSS